MDDSNQPHISTNSFSLQSIISFTIGMLVGSIIGTTRIVIIIFSIIAYDSKDSIIELLKNLSHQNSFINLSIKSEKNNNSWYDWCRGLIGFRR